MTVVARVASEIADELGPELGTDSLRELALDRARERRSLSPGAWNMVRMTLIAMAKRHANPRHALPIVSTTDA